MNTFSTQCRLIPPIHGGPEWDTFAMWLHFTGATFQVQKQTVKFNTKAGDRTAVAGDLVAMDQDSMIHVYREVTN